MKLLLIAFSTALVCLTDLFFASLLSRPWRLGEERKCHLLLIYDVGHLAGYLSLRVLGVLLQVVVSVAEHHSNLEPWQMACQATGATLRAVPITKDTQEIDLQVCIRRSEQTLISEQQGLFAYCNVLSVLKLKRKNNEARLSSTVCDVLFAGSEGDAVKEDKGGSAGACLKHAGVSAGHCICCRGSPQGDSRDYLCTAAH